MSTPQTIEATEPIEPAPGDPAPFFEIYGLSYAFGLILLLPAILLIGSQPLYSFNAFYTATLAIPPIAASLLLLATEPTSLRTGSIARRAALLTVLGVLGSILALAAGTPVVILLFLNGVGHSQALTGLVSAVGLVIVGSPMVYALVRSVRARSWLRVLALAVAIVALVVVIALTVSRGGFLVESMRRDQGEIMMGLLEWCVPAFAVTTAFVRRRILA